MRNLIVSVVASLAHEDWRNEWRRQNGEKPYFKTTADEEWIAANNGTTDVDMAATAYADLPPDLQNRDRLRANIAVGAVLAASKVKCALNDRFVEETAAAVHAKWTERNGNGAAEGTEKQFVELPNGEKEKDRLFVRRAIDAYRQHI